MPVFRIKPFLPEIVKDPKDVSSRFQGQGIIPYASTSTGTAQGYLDLLFSLYELSPSHGICIKNINDWAFGGNMGFQKTGISGLLTSNQADNTIPDNEAVSIAYTLEDIGLPISRIQELQWQIFKSYKVCGNAWLRVVVTRSAQARGVMAEVIDPRNIALLPKDQKTGIQSVVWSDDKPLNSKSPSKLKLGRVWPAVVRDSRTTEFFFQFSNAGSEYYGRPDTIMAIMPMITEARQEVLFANIANNDLAMKFILMVQEITAAGEEIEQQDGGAARAVIKNIRKIGGDVDIEGDSQVMAAIGYPEEADTPTVVKLDGNRDSQYFQFSSGNASGKIFAAHNWSKVLSGYETAPAGIGANIILDEFKVKNITTIQPTQQRWSSNWATVFSAIAKVTELEQLSGIAPKFQDRIAAMVEAVGTVNTPNQTPTQL